MFSTFLLYDTIGHVYGKCVNYSFITFYVVNYLQLYFFFYVNLLENGFNRAAQFEFVFP